MIALKIGRRRRLRKKLSRYKVIPFYDEFLLTYFIHLQGAYIIPGPWVRAINGGYLLNLLFVDATSPKGMGQRESWGKYYLGNCIDGNYKSHIGFIGHGQKESDDSWYIMLKEILGICYEIYGNDFDIF